MKIVVIGGSGLVGTKLVTRLRQQDHDAAAASPASVVNTVTRAGPAGALSGPQVVPGHYTLWQAASSDGTQAFLLIGTLLLPVILMYTAWSFWVFRAKMRGDIGYH